MTRIRCWGLLPAVFFLATPLFAQHELKLGNGLVAVSGLATVPVSLSNEANVFLQGYANESPRGLTRALEQRLARVVDFRSSERSNLKRPATHQALPSALASGFVEGVVAVAQWDSVRGTGEKLVAGPAIAGPDVVSTRIEAGYFALGVVLDNDGVDGEIIAAGADQLLVSIEIRCNVLGSSTAPSLSRAPVRFSTTSLLSAGFRSTSTPGWRLRLAPSSVSRVWLSSSWVTERARLAVSSMCR